MTMRRRVRQSAAAATAAGLVFLPLSSGADQSAADIHQILTQSSGPNADKNWADYLVDTAIPPVAAAGMLGISGEAIKPIENVRALLVAAQGLSTADSKTSLATSITPARTSIMPMNLSTYAKSLPARILGSVTFGYAQGDASISDATFERRAVSVETNFFFDAKRDDPVVAFANAVEARKGDCAILRPSPPEQTTPTGPASGPAKPALAPASEAEEARKRANSCREGVMKSMRWNRSQMSVHFATGRIKSKSGGNEVSLGNAFAAGLIYGIGDSLAASAIYRRTTNEPVLDSLVTGDVRKRNTSLAILELSGGSDRMRGVLQGSNAKTTDVTASQRVFKWAAGLDVRVVDEVWVNFRVGHQAKVDGSGSETGSVLSLSWSPKAIIASK